MLKHISVRRLVASVLFIALLLAFVIGQQYNQGAEENGLKVLYAGNPGSPRMEEFAAFLKPHFARVDTCDLQGNFQEQARAYDVVVLDWTSTYKRDDQGKIVFGFGTDQSLTPTFKIDAAFNKPVVMIGAVAGHAAISRPMAINWKCLCLDDYAHDTDTNHPIFKGPLPVNIPWETIEKPFDYFTYPGSKKIGEEIKVWRVQQEKFPIVDPGLVSNRERFTSAANAEAISGGINGKGPSSVAIGRHANFFLWGFAASPNQMTESAKAAFVNSIHYMKDFDGQTPGEYEYSPSDRDDFLLQVYQLRMLSDDYAKRSVEKMKEMIKQSNPTANFLAQLGNDPDATYRKMIQPMMDQILERIPADVRSGTHDDPEKLIAYYSEDLDYLTKDDDNKYVIDEDLRSLGISNRTPEMLAKCIDLLDSSDKAAIATKLLHRYAGDKAKTAADWKAWYERSGKKMKLDEGSYKFYLQ